MSAMTLTCDQAIFTSIRTPTGEGYRIIAASRGIRSDEKQAITRSSPSHDSLCRSAEDAEGGSAGAYAVAFYELPSGRLCVAISCYAGAEHTGRGGQRVYTHNLIHDDKDFSRCGYNPFAVVRAMVEMGLILPQLKPPPVLPQLQLPIGDTSAASIHLSRGLQPARCADRRLSKDSLKTPKRTEPSRTNFPARRTGVACVAGGEIGAGSGSGRDTATTPVLSGTLNHGSPVGRPGGLDLREVLSSDWRRYALEALLEGKSLILNVPHNRMEATEALLMGIPGPMRKKISFSAGLRFSVGRCHRLSLLNEDPAVIKSRIAGRCIEYFDSSTTTTNKMPAARPSAWSAFVERHWRRGDIVTLSRRTSKAFPDCSPEGRERIGRLYNELDAIPETETAALLSLAAGYLEEPERGVETEIVAELLVTTQRELLERMNNMRWDDAISLWRMICAMPRQSTEACLFVQPLIERGLCVAGRTHPAVAAEAALALLPNVSASAAAENSVERTTGLAQVIDDVLANLAEWVERAADAELEELHVIEGGLAELVLRWRKARPQCPIVRRIHQRCTGITPVQSPG